MTHRHLLTFTIMAALLVCSCGPSEEEKQRREQARQDSLEQARQDSLRQVRQQQQDSLKKVRDDSLAKTRQDETGVPSDISFSESGRFAVLVEAWRSRVKAQKRVEQWKERGYTNASVAQYGDESTGDVWFRVQLGRVDNRQSAEQLQKALQQQHQAESWVVGR